MSLVESTLEAGLDRGSTESFAGAVLAGLQQSPRTLPCKYFYDRRGSALFDRICTLDEYYLTRSELAIMRAHVAEMAALVGSRCLLVEYGSGSSLKTRLLLDHLQAPAGYVPIDICGPQLQDAAARLSQRYPRLPIAPLCADYTEPFALPGGLPERSRILAYFPGSTVGNFEPHEAQRFLRRVRTLCGHGGGLLIGVDLKKDPRLLHAAYNDAAGVTASFNLNLLERINRELGGDLVVQNFAHYACYNPPKRRIEMHLISLANQEARICGQRLAFRDGESILTECSYKYTLDEFAALAELSGFAPCRTWQDPHHLFAVHYLVAR